MPSFPTGLSDSQASAQLTISNAQLAAVRAKIPAAQAAQAAGIALAKSLAAQQLAQATTNASGSPLHDLIEQESQLLIQINGLKAGRASLGG